MATSAVAILLLLLIVICVIVIVCNQGSTTPGEKRKDNQRTTWVILTASLIDQDHEERQREYDRGIRSAIAAFADLPRTKLCIVENNNNKTHSFLDRFGIPVLYTNNNSLNVQDKGLKELQDVRDAITHFGIKDNDFIIKMTARYYIPDPDCPFVTAVKENRYEGIVRFGSCMEPAKVHKVHDCITGLIGMNCRSVRSIVEPKEYGCIEWAWGRAMCVLPDDAVCKISHLGVMVAFGGMHNFRLV